MSWANVVAFFITVSIITVSIIWRGWVLHTLWGWFMVPILGLPMLGISQSIGVMLVANCLVMKNVPRKESVQQILQGLFLNPLSLLLIGWVTNIFIIGG